MTTTATKTRKRAPKPAEDDPIAQAGAADEGLEPVEDAEPVTEPVDGGEIEAAVTVGGDDDELVDDWDEDDDEDEQLPQVQTTVKVKARKGGKVVQKTVRLVHESGCPALRQRVESYPAKTPAGRNLVITRCCDCAASIRTKV